MRGKLKAVIPGRQYGFIICPEVKHDVFYHYSELKGSLKDKPVGGKEVEFELVPTDRKNVKSPEKAVNVVPIEDVIEEKVKGQIKEALEPVEEKVV